MYIVALIVFIDFLGFGLIIPLTPVFQTIYNLSPFQVGLFTSLFFVANLFGGLFLGPLSDKVGRKPILLITTFGLAIAYFANAFIQLYESSNTFYTMLVLRVIIGLFSGNVPVAFACGVDLSSSNLENRRKVMALMGSVIGLGFMLGPTLGGIFSELTVTKSIAPFYFAAMASLASFILVLVMYKESLPKYSSKALLNSNIDPINARTIDKENSIAKQLKFLLTNTKVLIPLLLFVGFFFTFTGFEVYLITIVMGEQLKLSQLYIGLFWTAFAFFNSVFQFALLKVAKMRQALIWGFFIYAIGIFSYIVTSFSIWWVSVSMILCAIGIGFVLPNINAAVSLEGTPHQQGLIFGINQSFGAVGRFLGPFLLGWLFTVFNTVNVIWIFMGALMLLQSLVVIKSIPKEYNPKKVKI